MSLTQQAHQAILSHLKSLDKIQFRFSIDATCGNGFDTLFLAELTEKKVFSFDIQGTAISNTQHKLSQTPYENKVVLLNQSHTNMLKYCQRHMTNALENVDVITFNLGYLPRADKTITTNADSTITALDAAIQLLSSTGIISIICYRGHDGGLKESNAVLAWLNERKLQYEIVDSTKANETTPFLLVVKN